MALGEHHTTGKAGRGAGEEEGGGTIPNRLTAQKPSHRHGATSFKAAGTGGTAGPRKANESHKSGHKGRGVDAAVCPSRCRQSNPPPQRYVASLPSPICQHTRPQTSRKSYIPITCPAQSNPNAHLPLGAPPAPLTPPKHTQKVHHHDHDHT